MRLGEGVADNLKQTANQELISIGNELLSVISEFIKGKIKNVNLDVLFNEKNKEKLLNLWSEQIVGKGLISRAYTGLPDEVLIDNLHQTGYLEGMYVGYILVMMSLVDNEAPKDLILSVRDDVRPNLLGHHFNNRDELVRCYKNEKYEWINSAKKADEAE